MASENIEDYYNELITYWPNESLISDTILHMFNKSLGKIENMMLADQLNYFPMTY